MRKFFILWILIVSSVLYGQKDSAKLFEPSLIKADIDTLISKMLDVHPTFLSYYQKNKLQPKIDSIKSNIKKPLSALDLFRIMQPIICIDGHTTLTYNGEIYPKIDNPFFPFKVVIYKNNLYVKENLSDNKSISKGSIISSINGIPSITIIKNLIQYLPGENESYKTKSLETQFHIFYQLVYGSCSEFNIAIQNTDFKVKSAKNDNFQEPSKPKFEMRFYDNDIAYIYKRSFKPPKDFIHFMDSAFNEISKRQVKYLIIDNLKGGGMTDLADSLIAYFTDKPYCLYEKKMTKVSPLTKDFIASKKSEGYFKDNYFIQEFQLHKSTRVNRFTGTTYILTGTLSYSTGTCFPASAKCYKAAFIVGEETGQPLLSNGDLNRFILSNTQLTCFTSLSKIYMPCNNNDSKNGLLPDFNVTPSLEDLLNDKDYALEYALKLIKEKKDKE
jgi:C-terminal processing protease CtpA/Prc